MKTLFKICCVLFLSTTALADVSTSISLTSDYIWRGVTQTGHDSAVQGSMDYGHGGFSLGVWTSSLNDKALGQEVDLYGQYAYKINDNNTIALGAVNFTYTRDANANFGEYYLKYTHTYAELYIGTSSDYLATDSAASYVSISTGFTLSEKDKVVLKLSIGQTTWDDEEEAGWTNYSDYKVGIAKTKGEYEVELFMTGTSGRETGTPGADKSTFLKQEDDSTVGIMLNTAF